MEMRSRPRADDVSQCRENHFVDLPRRGGRCVDALGLPLLFFTCFFVAALCCAAQGEAAAEAT